MVELTMYTGLGYDQLVNSPAWFIETLRIRRKEEAEYNKWVSDKLKDGRK